MCQILEILFWIKPQYIPWLSKTKGLNLLRCSFEWDRKNRGLLLQHIWHDKDSFLLGDRIDSEVSERFIYLRFFVPLENSSLIWRRASSLPVKGWKFRPIPGTQSKCSWACHTYCDKRLQGYRRGPWHSHCTGWKALETKCFNDSGLSRLEIEPISTAPARRSESSQCRTWNQTKPFWARILRLHENTNLFIKKTFDLLTLIGNHFTNAITLCLSS